MQKSSSKCFLIIAALSFSWTSELKAQNSSIPDQKLQVALSTVSYTRKTVSTSDSGSVPFGFSAEYSLFLSNSTALFGQFEINFDTASQSVVFIGGGAGISWYLIGGANYSYNGTFIQSVAKPNSNLYLGLGLASREYDFLIVEKKKNEAAGSIVKRDKKDKLAGSFLGLMFALAYEYPIYFDLLPGARLQYVKSFSSDTEPDFTLIEIWLSIGFVF